MSITITIGSGITDGHMQHTRVGGRALLEATDDALALPQPPLSTLADEKSLVPKDALTLGSSAKHSSVDKETASPPNRGSVAHRQSQDPLHCTVTGLTMTNSHMRCRCVAIAVHVTLVGCGSRLCSVCGVPAHSRMPTLR